MAALLSVAVGPHCASDDVAHFTSERDAELVASLEGTWVAAGPEGPVTMVLCENADVAAKHADLNCGELLYIVRGDRHGQSEDVRVEEGCGGCLDIASAGLEGVVRLPDGTEVPVQGSAAFELTRGADPYDPPFHFKVSGGELPAEATVSVEARFEPGNVYNEALGRFERENIFHQAVVRFSPARSDDGGGGAAGGAGRPGAGGAGSGSAGASGRAGGQGEGGAAGDAGASGGAAGAVASGGEGGGAGAVGGAGGQGEGGAGASGAAGGQAEGGAGGSAGASGAGGQGEGGAGVSGASKQGKGGVSASVATSGQGKGGAAGGVGSREWRELRFERVAPGACGAR